MNDEARVFKLLFDLNPTINPLSPFIILYIDDHNFICDIQLVCQCFIFLAFYELSCWFYPVEAYGFGFIT